MTLFSSVFNDSGRAENGLGVGGSQEPAGNLTKVTALGRVAVQMDESGHIPQSLGHDTQSPGRWTPPGWSYRRNS